METAATEGPAKVNHKGILGAGKAISGSSVFWPKDIRAEFAADILDCMLKSRGNVPSNCAIALSDMHYEPAVGPVLEMLPHCEDLNTFFGILHYLGKIHREDCHHALQKVLKANKISLFQGR